MAFHTLAFGGNSSATVSTVASVQALADQIVTVSGTNFVLAEDMRLIAAFAGAPAASGLEQARVNSPRLRQLAPAYVMPQHADLTTLNDPNLMWVGDRPILLRGQEELTFEASASVASAALNGILWLEAGERFPAPADESMWVRFTSSGVATTENAWTANGSYTFTSGTLPAGTYAVVGFLYQQANALAARLIFDRQVWRPGTLAMNTINDNPHPEFQQVDMGIWGIFDAYSPPRIEVLGRTGGSSAASGALRLVQIRDPSEAQKTHSLGSLGSSQTSLVECRPTPRVGANQLLGYNLPGTGILDPLDVLLDLQYFRNISRAYSGTIFTNRFFKIDGSGAKMDTMGKLSGLMSRQVVC